MTAIVFKTAVVRGDLASVTATSLYKFDNRGECEVVGTAIVRPGLRDFKTEPELVLTKPFRRARHDGTNE